jgi:1,4-alpha-glucan branching enzyme
VLVTFAACRDGFVRNAAGWGRSSRQGEILVIRRTRVAKTAETKLTFVLPQGEPAGFVSVVGDFNDWTPGAHVLAKRSNGTRSVSVMVPTGSQVRFRYLGENGHWFDDPDADRHDGDCAVVDA